MLHSLSLALQVAAPLAQQTAAQLAAVTTPNDGTQVIPYLSSAATIVALQKWLKTQDAYGKLVAAFPGADKYVHWTIAGVSSLLAALGIHVVWNWTAIAGGQATFDIPNLQTLVHGGSDFFKMYILQHTIYEGTHQAPYVPPAPPLPPPAPAPAPAPLKGLA